MTQLASDRAMTETRAGHLNAIIVGTGRCGSTMLSNIFCTHADVLSLSEFFAMLNPPLYSEEVVNAATFWQILATPSPRLRAIIRPGTMPPEILYPFAETSRFGYETGVPPLLLVPLPHLTGDYEALFDELHDAVSTFPEGHLSEHYAHLFSWLEQHFGRRVAIERSGLSLPLLPELIALFPETKFVHLVREGRGCVWSMYRHVGFRLAAFFEGGVAVDLGEEKEGEDFLTRVLAAPIPFEAFGNVWTRNLVKGLQELSRLPEEQVLTVRYEDIIAHPRQLLGQIVDFIDPSLYDEEWLAQAAGLVKEQPAGWQRLPEAEREALERACASGQAVLDLLAQEGLYSEKLDTMLTRLSEQYM